MKPQNRRISREQLPSAPPDVEKDVSSRVPEVPRWFGRTLRVVRAVLGAALVVGLSGGVAWAVERHIVESPRFAVTEILVTGQQQRSSEAILEEAGLSKGTNIFTVNLDRARARLLADPWISEVHLARRLPGTLWVEITEREIGALVALGQPYLVSREGTIFKRLEPGDPTDLPVITGLDPGSVAEDRAGAEATLRRALDLASDYERTSLGQRASLQEIHVTPEGGFTLVVGKDGLTLALGAPPFRRKLEEAGKVIAETDRRGSKASVVMLDDEARPERVVVRTR